MARRGFAAAARGDLGAVAEMLAPDVKWHGGDPEYEGGCHNREQALAFMRAARADGRFGELVDVVDAGEKVVVIMQPPPVEGEPQPRRANVTRFHEGQVVEMIAFETPEDALAHAGLSSPPGDSQP
jgi:ketosteroid isomerase-like protein